MGNIVKAVTDAVSKVFGGGDSGGYDAIISSAQEQARATRDAAEIQAREARAASERQAASIQQQAAAQAAAQAASINQNQLAAQQAEQAANQPKEPTAPEVTTEPQMEAENKRRRYTGGTANSGETSSGVGIRL